MYFMFDAMVPYNQPLLLKCLTDSAGDTIAHREVRKIYVSIDEDSLRRRKGCIRPGVSFDQVEVLQIVTSSDWTSTLPMIKRKVYSGSNMGNKIGDVCLPEVDTMWKLTIREKHDLHGKYRVAVGGRTPGEEEGPGRGAKRKALDSLEPVFWHSRPISLYQELRHSYRIVAWIDLAPGDGVLATACAKERVPYLGFTLTDTHAEQLKCRIVTALLESSFTEGEVPVCYFGDVETNVNDVGSIGTRCAPT